MKAVLNFKFKVPLGMPCPKGYLYHWVSQLGLTSKVDVRATQVKSETEQGPAILNVCAHGESKDVLYLITNYVEYDPTCKFSLESQNG